ncbi:hypothetical protein BT69DRAFT_1292347 [Atractiella rhizophila]|nr:hypothetical protein BT69DRAFT_1292347 [Atractiella rhizophila]
MASGVEVVPKVDLERLLACEASFMRETDTVSRNRSVFNSWVEACHRAERRVGELQREVDKLKMEKDVLEEETRAVTDEHNELHNRLPQHLHQNFGPQPTQPQKWPQEADGETELIQLAKDRSAAMKDRINMLFDQSMDLDFENPPPLELNYSATHQHTTGHNPLTAKFKVAKAPQSTNVWQSSTLHAIMSSKVPKYGRALCSSP